MNYKLILAAYEGEGRLVSYTFEFSGYALDKVQRLVAYAMIDRTDFDFLDDYIDFGHDYDHGGAGYYGKCKKRYEDGGIDTVGAPNLVYLGCVGFALFENGELIGHEECFEGAAELLESAAGSKLNAGSKLKECQHKVISDICDKKMALISGYDDDE